MRISWAARTDPGRRRSQNEDAYCARPELGLFVVADGMGGHAGGEVASALAVEEIEELIRSTASLGPQDTWPLPFDRLLGRDGNRLRASFDGANRKIAKRIDVDDDLRGMATTAVAVLVNGGPGDPGPRRRQPRLSVSRRRARPAHARPLVGRGADAGGDAHRGGGAGAPVAEHRDPRALGGTDDLDVEVSEIALRSSDRLLLCSDGLSSVLRRRRGSRNWCRARTAWRRGA